MSNKIALTASMRSNLLSLKNTQSLMDKTQDHLSTGYKVNSAMESPSSYFTAQSLNSRANDLSTLLDGIGQAISTLEVADQGIQTLQSFVEQAKSVANSARETQNVSASVSSSIKFDSEHLTAQLVTEAIPNAVPATDKVTIRVGDATKLVGTTNVQADSKLSDLTLEPSADYAAGSIKIDGTEYNLVTKAAAGNQMEVAGTTGLYTIVSIDNRANGYITVRDKNGVEASFKLDAEIAAVGGHSAAVGDTVKAGAAVSDVISENGRSTLTPAASAFVLNDDGASHYAAAAATGALTRTISVAAGATLEKFSDVVSSMIGKNKFEASVVDGNLVLATKDNSYLEVTGKIADAFGLDDGEDVTLEATDTAESLRQKIATLEGVTAEFDVDGRMVIKSEQGDDLVISGDLAKKLGVAGAATNGSNERAAYAKQFNGIMSQIDELVQDTSYKGINLLKGDNLLVNFNESRTSSLELKGVTFDSVGLGFTAAAKEWVDNASIDKALTQITKATSMLRAQASEFGQNLSAVQIREDFTQNMINNLQSGADKLTLADMNEEAANMLAVQTRQQLGVNSLSLASQASQSVLRLF